MTKEPNVWADTPEEVEALASNGGAGNVVNLKLVEGDNTVRVVGRYFFFKEHWINKVQRTVVCPGKDCPICSHPDRQKFLDKAKALRQAGNEEQAKALFRKTFETYDPRPQYAINVIDRKDGKVKVWKFSRTIKEHVMNIAGKYGDVNNYDLIITRTGKGRDTEYSVIPDRENKPLTEEEKQLKLFNLGVLFKVSSMDKINAYMRGELPKKATKSTEADAPTIDVDLTVAPQAPTTEIGDLDVDLEGLGDLGL